MQAASWTIFFIRSRQVRKHSCHKLSLKNISSNRLYHPKCSVKCTACNALIGAEEYVKLGEFSFHWNCYKCKVCKLTPVRPNRSEPCQCVGEHICPNFLYWQISGAWARPYYWKTHPNMDEFSSKPVQLITWYFTKTE